MCRKFLQFAVLVSLSGACPAWASQGTPPRAPELASPSLAAPRLKPVAAPHCMSCHESMVRIRTRQQVRSLAGLRNQVSRWAQYLKLRWSSEDLNEVVAYLDRQYYQFESR